MAIIGISIKNVLAFQQNFTADFCTGINVIIGENGVGKTTLLKALHDSEDIYEINRTKPIPSFGKEEEKSSVSLECAGKIDYQIYIPEKDILENARGLLPFVMKKDTAFSDIYKNVLISAQDIPTSEQTETQRSLGEKISNIIGGTVEWVASEGTYYTIKKTGLRVPFLREASGYKKLGYLGIQIASGQLEPGSILFWDEPENSLNPALASQLVDILLELSRSGVQIFIATHNEVFASYFAVNRQNGDNVLFTSLYKDGEEIKADTSHRFDFLTPNSLTAEPVKLYEKHLEKGLGND
ncbi:MAG: AAA family ATPase [Defluviitaleaceae bacterium]|nr:AAA family ATPase [Defluviitaleaceae bacterium]